MTGSDYGDLSLFRDPARLAGERARELALQNLEARGRSPDEVAVRAEYLDLLGVRPGHRVLDVGRGSGVVTRDVARRVSPSGQAVGVDPSATFLAIARDLARAEGLVLGFLRSQSST
jgi:SAM-dependent methyltransferase